MKTEMRSISGNGPSGGSISKGASSAVGANDLSSSLKPNGNIVSDSSGIEARRSGSSQPDGTAAPPSGEKKRHSFYLTEQEEIEEISNWTINIRNNHTIQNTTGLSNAISTTKYSLISFVPVSIFEQFRRLANIYFLIMSLLMILGQYTSLFKTPLDPWSTAGTLCFVLSVTSAKEGVEDYGRFRSDVEENGKIVTICVLENGKFVEKEIRCEDVKGGDIIKLKGHCVVPADIVLLLTSMHADGNQCYIETANIDGETNLKVREAPAGLKTNNLINGALDLPLTSGSATFEPPNKNIHNFSGFLQLNSCQEKISIGPDNVLLRGSLFSNTDWAYGVALYCGMDSKVQMNSKMAKSKMSRLEEKLNTAVKLIFGAQVLLVTASVISIYALGFGENDQQNTLPYVFPQAVKCGTLPCWLGSWLTFFILYNNFIPISLYVTIEMVNLGQGWLISGDQHIYNAALDCPTAVRASNMCQELGMVSNVFSDKTGTLTRNEMKFVKFVIDGKLYDINKDPANPVFAQLRQSNVKTSKMYSFLKCLTTCHTVIREKDGTYRADSPDELALVEGVGPFGCSLLERGTILMNVEFLGQKQNFEILAVNAFNADRKRMSVLLRDIEADEYYCMCKGADNIMLPLTVLSADESRSIQKALLDLAVLSLRTLVIAQKKLDHKEAKAWLQTYKEAASSLAGRAEKMAVAAATLEQGMTLLGITAIEDRLQDEVPEVIADMAKAGIITWMLTGDKEETAVNIGKSCNLILQDTKLFYVSGIKTADSFDSRLEAVYQQVSKSFIEGSGFVENGEKKEITLVMDGPSFVYFDEKDLDQRKWLLFIGKCCRSVIGCRLTPTQKAQLVGLVKTDTVPTAITLAIGDGANDVSMIREGNVGVGIFGKEGRQAANNADFAIGEFKYLRRLLLVHGRWNYMRQARVFLYSMHKNIVITLTLFWYSYYTAVSGTSLYESWIYTSFNFCLGLPIIFYGMMDRDISESFALANPSTYATSRDNIYLSLPTIAAWMLNAVLYAVILCVIFYISLNPSFKTYTIFEMGTVVFSGLVFSLQLKVMFMHHFYTWHQAAIMAISVGGTLLFYYALSSGLDSDYNDVGTFVMNQGIFWFYGFFSGPLFTVMLDVFSYYGRSCIVPTRETLFRETEHYKQYVENDIICKTFRPPIHPYSAGDQSAKTHSPLFC